MSVAAILLAAGVGKRMQSALSKVLHPIAGRPLVHYPLVAAVDGGAEHIVLVLNPSNRKIVAEYVARTFPRVSLSIAVQEHARGTGDAASVGVAELPEGADEILILCGDTPLLRASDLERLREERAKRGLSLTFLTCTLPDPTGYGRVLRDRAGRVARVCEERDLVDEQQRAVREVNAGVYAVERRFLEAALKSVTLDNAQGEHYLTDIVASAAREQRVEGVPGDPASLVGVNDRAQLAEAERVLYDRIRIMHQQAGVTVRGEARIESGVVIEPDAIIEHGVSLRGRTAVRRGAVVDVGCVVSDSEIEADAWLKPYCVVTQSRVGERAEVGPFAHLRPESELDEDARVGNFVELKKTRLRRGAKANHLAYLGDGDVGEGANIGAGTIFCNYDGVSKAKTVIGARVFIGSDSQIVAPVSIGDGAYVATGTTVTEDVPADSLVISRGRQVTNPNYAPRLRDRLAAQARPPKSK